MMKNTNKITNDKANDFIEIMNSLKESGEIQFVNYKWDEENGIFDVFIIPK